MNLVNYDCPEGIPESEFVPLDVMSDNSIGESIARIPELVKKAKSLNMKALVLTDRTLSGSIEFYQLCMANNVKPIIGQKIIKLIPADIFSTDAPKQKGTYGIASHN